MLKPIQFPEKKEPEYGSDSPIVTCECCGSKGPAHLMINVICFVGSPGHPSLSPLQCPAIEHWSCGLPCWSKVVHACIDEHMVPYLQAIHAQLTLEENQNNA